MVPRHARLEPGQLARRGQSREREDSTGVADHWDGQIGHDHCDDLWDCQIGQIGHEHCDDETLLLANW